MLRRSLFLAGLALCLFLFESPAAEARIVHRGNPAAHFNIGGLNYGSMRWERQHGYRGSLLGRSSRSGWRGRR